MASRLAFRRAFHSCPRLRATDPDPFKFPASELPWRQRAPTETGTPKVPQIRQEVDRPGNLLDIKYFARDTRRQTRYSQESHLQVTNVNVENLEAEMVFPAQHFLFSRTGQKWKLAHDERTLLKGAGGDYMNTCDLGFV
eukprot:TRINITY_DN14904_c0_g1::TRINITY_DN14904_c0_g1_i1::g.16321::m.16321 TRINITY_DN14904_c0_g1::TRINITY_DN14904_c0_g1_i1::g.16321  ORF type:complete len:153 (+),score=16.12 TRINITY_DN14904_c0_g1_i1:45-461(+)